jgi:hypothetical protein
VHMTSSKCSIAASRLQSGFRGWVCLQVAALLLATYRTLLPWLRDDQVELHVTCASRSVYCKVRMVYASLRQAMFP